MSFITKNRNLIIGAVVVLLLIGGYFMFFTNNAPTPDLTAAATSGSPAEDYFINLAGELNGLTFNTNIFKDARFNALIDIHTAVLPEQSGRPDPFAPIVATSTGQ